MKKNKLDLETYNKILQLVNNGYVSCRKHNDVDYYIYNYTVKTQFEWLWTKETMMCRGLILDGEQNIIARPFGKFFTLEQLGDQKIPEERFELTDKLDGSEGILYHIKEQPFIATRGSFDSDQAKRANEILYSKYQHIFPLIFKSNVTYIFEIIYPENRIVVDYGDMEDLILLAMIDNYTGLDLSISNIGFSTAQTYNGFNDIDKLKKLEEKNREGFVAKFPNSFRIKIKFNEYLQLHRLFTNTSMKDIHGLMAQGKDVLEILGNIPDEFHQWVIKQMDYFKSEYKRIEKVCKKNFVDLGDRKKNALHYRQFNYSGILFMMLDGKDYSKNIWKIIKPKKSIVYRKGMNEEGVVDETNLQPIYKKKIRKIAALYNKHNNKEEGMGETNV